MSDGCNCRPPRTGWDLEDHHCHPTGSDVDLEAYTCARGDAYMNDEGTWIPCRLVRAGHALAKSDYHAHKICERCRVNPRTCDWRLQQLRRRASRSTITAPPFDGDFEFFVDEAEVSREVLEAFHKRNDGPSIYSSHDPWTSPRFPHYVESNYQFKGKTGFLVRSSFRFNTEDLNQLKRLSRGIQRTSGPSDQPFSEFTRYTELNTTTSSSSTTQAPGAAQGRSTSVPNPPKRTPNQCSGRAASNNTPPRSQPTRTRTNVDENRSLPTARPSGGTRSDRYQEQLPGRPSCNRTSSDSNPKPRDRVGSTSLIRPTPQDRTYSPSQRQADPRTSNTQYGASFPAGATAYNTQDYGGPYPSRSAAATEGSSMLGTVPAANGNPTFVGTIYIININNHITAERAAGTGGKPGNVKCGVLAAGIDLEVLDLYVKQCIDPGAHTGKQSLNGRDYFWVETSRMLTLEERQDMINDSRSWKREQEQGRGYPSAYQDSETARSRRRAGGAGRR